MRTGKTAFKDSKRALYAIGVISIIPVIFGLVGLFFLQGLHYIIGLILALSAGGIYYMLFYDMIPKAHKDRKMASHIWCNIRFYNWFCNCKIILITTKR